MKYLEQYNRMLRYFKKFEMLNDGIPHDVSQFYFEDEDVALAFFMNCYHLKDWIINDEGLEIENKTKIVEEYVHKSNFDELKICAHICNGAKHLKPFSNTAQMNTKTIELSIGASGGKIKVNFQIEFEGKQYDAFNVASVAVKKWEEFLTANAPNFTITEE